MLSEDEEMPIVFGLDRTIVLLTEEMRITTGAVAGALLPRPRRRLLEVLRI